MGTPATTMEPKDAALTNGQLVGANASPVSSILMHSAPINASGIQSRKKQSMS